MGITDTVSVPTATVATISATSTATVATTVATRTRATATPVATTVSAVVTPTITSVYSLATAETSAPVTVNNGEYVRTRSHDAADSRFLMCTTRLPFSFAKKSIYTK